MTTYEAYSEKIALLNHKASQVESPYIKSIWLKQAYQMIEKRAKMTVKEAETPWIK